jgi:hypothetical protein
MMAAQIRLQFSYLFNLWTIERFRDERTLRWTNETDCFPVAENFYLASLNRSKLRAFASRASTSGFQFNRLGEMLYIFAACRGLIAGLLRQTTPWFFERARLLLPQIYVVQRQHSEGEISRI